MKKLRTPPATLVAIPLTLLLCFVCVLLMGGGHGTFIPAIVVFPFGMAAAVAANQLTTTAVVFGLIQFVTYGIIIDFTKNGRHAISVIGLITLIHVLMVVAVMITNNGVFD